MRVVIDRIEDGIATVELENGRIIQVSGELFWECKEGDVVDITVNKELTEQKNTALKIDVSKLFDN